MQTKSELKDKLVRLHKALAAVKKDRKVAMSNYRDDIKEIEKEMEETVEAIDNLNSA